MGARRADASLSRRARLRFRARRSARQRRVGRAAVRRVRAAGAGRRAGSDRVARAAELVQRRGRDDGHLLGRLQRIAGRRTSPAGAEGDHHAMLHRRPLSRRRAFHGRRDADRQVRLGVVLLRGDVPSARSGAGRRAMARDVAGAVAERAAVPGTLAAPPAARRLLEARLGLRGLRGDRMPGLRGRRLDGRLHQRDPAPAGRIVGAAQGADRAVGTRLPALRDARPADRLSAGDAALVGSLAEGHRHRRDARTDAAGVDDAERAARDASRRAAGAMDRRTCVARAGHRAAPVVPHGSRLGRSGVGPDVTTGALAPGGRARRRGLVPVRPRPGRCRRPARG